ncbi:MAG: exonuclease domain-containing protein [Campylobacterales bacterium]|nr:exonuclease domain-containing protein [Campylobacterales bacterium]
MLIFLDVETTGLEVEDKICSIGLVAVEGDKVVAKYDLVNEGKKISSKASAINHITNEMLKNTSKVAECETYKFLQEYNNESTTLVAHNSKFDLKMLAKCGFNYKGQVIDTLRVTKHLIPECEGFALGFLRYELKLYREEKKELLGCGVKDTINPHNALSDAIVVKLLYEYLLEMVSKEEMCTLSTKSVLMQKLSFGKYAGQYIEEISIRDSSYLQWMLANILDLDEDLRYSINYFLQGRV